MLLTLTVTVNLVDAVVRDQVCKLCRFADCRFKSLFWFASSQKLQFMNII